MPQSQNRSPRRRVFAPGTETDELRFTVTKEEAAVIRRMVDDGDTSLSKMVVAALLSPARAITAEEKGELMGVMVGARSDIGRVKMTLDRAVEEGVIYMPTADAMAVELRRTNGLLRTATERLA